MTSNELKNILVSDRFICAVKDEEGLENCIKNDSKVVFVLFGTVMNICRIVKRIKSADKIAFVLMILFLAGSISSRFIHILV